MKRILGVLIIGFIFTNAYAEKQDIVATVNNIPITDYDIEARRNIIKMINNIGTLNSEQDKQLSEASLESLIEEQLLLQHGKKMKKIVTEEQIDAACANIEQTNKMPPGALANAITARGASVASFRDKIKADILKMSFMSQLADHVNVSAQEIDATILNGAHKDADIVALLFTSSDKSPDTYRMMNVLQQKLKTCDQIDERWYADLACIKNINNKLSKLDMNLQSIVKDAAINTATNVFETPEGLNILLVCNKTTDPLTTEEKQLVVDFLTNKKVNKKALKIFSEMKKNAIVKKLKTF